MARVDFRYNQCIQQSHQYNDIHVAAIVVGLSENKKKKIQLVKFKKPNRRSVHYIYAYGFLTERAREMHTTRHNTHIVELFVDIL